MSDDRISGFALILGGVIALAVMAFHPTGRDIIDAAGRDSAGSTTIVHAVAIAAEILLAFGAVALSVRLGDQRDLAVGALVAYAFGTMALIIAAVASGWLAPGALVNGVTPQGDVTDVAMALFRQSGRINQAFAAIGFSLVAIAITLWSVAMLRARLSRGLGVFGLVTGIVVLGGIASGHGLALHGLGGMTMLAQLVWMGLAGVLLLRLRSAR